MNLIQKKQKNCTSSTEDAHWESCNDRSSASEQYIQNKKRILYLYQAQSPPRLKRARDDDDTFSPARAAAIHR